LEKGGAKIIHTSFDDHDKLVSLILALPHFINIAMVNTLRATGTDPNLLRQIAGTTFKLQLLTAQAIYQEDFGNEVSILMDSKHSLKALERFAQECIATMNIIKKEERNSMIRNLRAHRDFLQKDRLFASATSRFNAAVEASNPR
jgi:prephenate dehydrogenase